MCRVDSEGHNMKHFTLAATLLSAIAIAPTANAQFFEDIEVTSTIDTVSEYVFRGVSLGENSVQPGTEFSVYGFTAGSWYSAGFGDNSAAQLDELDLYASYELPFEGPVQLGIGGTAYIYPQGNDLIDSSGGTVATYEVNATAGFEDVILSPSILAAYDFTLDSFTIEGNLSHSFDLPREGWSLDAGLNIGHVELDQAVTTTTIDEAFDSYQYGTISLTANKAITDKIGFHAGANFTVNTEENTLNFGIVDGTTSSFNDSDTVFWIGTGLSVGF